MEVKRTERGWAGHYICSDQCKFRRNTLLECGDTKWIVSTIGGKILDGKPDVVGWNRWYETMAFKAELEHGYWDADVTKEICFESPWGIFAESFDELVEQHPHIDNYANEMHETVVAELMQKITETV